MTRRGIFITIGVFDFLAGGAILAFAGGSTTMTAFGTLLAVSGLGLAGYAWMKRDS